ncbi:oxygen-insensitive NAD(P)H nitroreductase [Paraburkholderia sp. CNPSo 3076]|uniref:oxygen-insensitive NAD(P)H nitroreductase n=1 Tax=Paraburkholderia sp. CNPSo 3076 TaxID=2940936 RepID=UPI002250A929|nr:oxygen-insensitive NAD(P)H nitroreductase [Paraburkholderia sp. CNPSo 3076]MCX5544057.1 oxygen-insensitive NAD(P)H nitroreductase [Paraburkholderia sp. CNPSo 3076]
MNLTRFAKARHATKAFDPARKIPAAVIDELKELIRFSPSSVNSQPWHFVLAESDAARARIARGMEGFAYNEPKVTRASHVVVLCVRTEMDEAHLAEVLAQEEADGRFANAEAKAVQEKTRSFYVNLHRERNDLPAWLEKQAYLALGALLIGASTLEIDACPMEGFDAKALDEELGLREQGLTALVVVGLGYRSADDFNAKLPKSRLSAASVFTDLG